MDDEINWDHILYTARNAVTGHEYFNKWYEDLTPHLKQLVDDLLDHNVTPEMIYAAQDTTEQERTRNIFVRALGNGNLDPTIANNLTEIVLRTILFEIKL